MACVASARPKPAPVVITGHTICKRHHRCVLRARLTAYGRRLVAHHRRFIITLTITLTFGRRTLLVESSYRIPLARPKRR
jgi:hypothetical protein